MGLWGVTPRPFLGLGPFVYFAIFLDFSIILFIFFLLFFLPPWNYRGDILLTENFRGCPHPPAACAYSYNLHESAKGVSLIPCIMVMFGIGCLAFNWNTSFHGGCAQCLLKSE